ncbi:MAG TPA: DASS family sodium-coupled anion symporter [Alphaproteobacteria bacterium]
MTGGDAQVTAPSAVRRRVALAVGALLFVVLLAVPEPGGFTPASWRVVAVVALMAAWWIGEALPLPVTALVPLVAFPTLGVGTIGDSAAPYANPLIFLLLGGFMLGLAFERTGMHRRIAVAIVHRANSRADVLVGGFMLAAAGLSIWISNTASTAMMLPIALSVLAIAEPPDRAAGGRDLGPPLLLAIAFGAGIGGMSTLIGSPPNALLGGYMADAHGMTVGFARWMAVGGPVAALLLVVAWLVLTRMVFRVDGIDLAAARRQFEREHHGLGPVSTAERRVLMVGVAAIAGWFARPVLAALWPGLGLSDAGIAIAAGLALFLVPAGRGDGTALLEWSAMRDVNWGVLLLVGGGLSLGAAIDDSGLAGAIGAILAAHAPSSPWLVAMAAAVVAMMISHVVASNTATAAALVPLLNALAVRLDQPPMQIAMPAVLALSCAFMLPVATPPNAIVYGTGRVSVGQMLRAGAPIAVAGIVIIGAVGYPLAALVFGG